QVVIAGRGIQQVSLLLDGRKFRITLISDQVQQRIAYALVGNLQNRFPLWTAGIVAKFDHVRGDRSEFHLELVIVKFRGVETDLLLPLPEVISPVIKCSNLS